MLFSLSLVWLASEIIHKNRDIEEKVRYSVSYALSRIDAAGILFFLGILLAVACLEQFHLLKDAATYLNHAFNGDMSLMALTLGLLSAIVDNVPLVSASMGMFDLSQFPQDHRFWHLIAYCAGTGGSILIIGSAAGVAVMGVEQIRFGWYMKRFSLLALIGYIAGALVCLSLTPFLL
jgi:Na+/H+ antiporter NhaD/arsenite permease-like protein